MVFRKDKRGIILKVIIRTLKSGCCGDLNWCLLVEKREDNSALISQICSHLKFELSNLCEQCTIRILVEVRN